MQLITACAFVALFFHTTPAISHPTKSKRFVEPRVSNSTIRLRHVNSLGVRDTGLTGGPHYFGDFNLNGQPISAIVDTGSSDLVISSNVVASTAIQPPYGSCAENYGGRGPVQGQISSGNYHFADFDVQGQFCYAPLPVANAVMGLGFYLPAGPTVNGQTGDSPLYQYADHGLSSFGIYLSLSQGGGGAWTTNGYDPQYLTSGFLSESVTKRGSKWSFDMSGTFTIGGSSFQLGSNSAFVDSGTPTINVPAAAATQIWQAVGADPNTGAYGSCNPGGDPVVLISAAGNQYSIQAVHYVVPDGNGGCRNAFQPQANANQAQAILGTPFMKAYYSYFDYGNSQLSFATSSG